MRRTVLSVDDNEAHNYAMARELETAGFRALRAANGTDALATAVREKPDLILLDMNLPDILGTEVCRQLKSLPETCGIPVVFHTMSDSVPSLDTMRQLGAAAFLTYPIERQHLVNVIRGCLARTTQE